jgi:hypothetical protein
MNTRRNILLVGTVALLAESACGAAAGGSKTPPSSAGSSVEQPIMRCGPQDSYEYIAREVRCADGKNPFAGNVEAARRSRSGSQARPRSDHLVDTYEVPCASGTMTVFVDMYGCPEEQEKLRSFTERLSPAAEKLMTAYDSGDHPHVLERCGNLRDDESDLFTWCLILEPASLVLLNERAAAVHFMENLCSKMPAAGPKSDARAVQVTLTMAFIARASGKPRPITIEEANATLDDFARACAIDPTEVVRRLETERS